MTLRIGIAGIHGRMGREVAALIAEEPTLQLAGGIVRTGQHAAAEPESCRIVEDPAELLSDIDVLIDFTAPEVAVKLARAAASAGRGFVTGTTGFSPAQYAQLQAASERIPVFASRNLSIGINAVLELLPSLVRALDGYDIEIIERHHRTKRDAPSGTALLLAEVISGVRSSTVEERAVFGRHGVGQRADGELGIHSVRAGGNIGEHTILFAAEGEEITLGHRALSRRTFASGALRAATYIADKPPGWYTMRDLIHESLG